MTSLTHSYLRSGDYSPRTRLLDEMSSQLEGGSPLQISTDERQNGPDTGIARVENVGFDERARGCLPPCYSLR